MCSSAAGPGSTNPSPSTSSTQQSGDKNTTASNKHNTPAVGRKRNRDGDMTPTLSFASPIALLSSNQKINYASTVTSAQADRKPFKRFRLADAHDNDIDDQDTRHVAALDTERFQNAVDVPLVVAEGSVTSTSLLLDLIPQDVLMTNICCYLTDASDYYSLQLSCKKFQEVSNETAILRKVDLAGEASTGKGSILYQVNVPSVGVQKLYKFAAAGNQQAVYM